MGCDLSKRVLVVDDEPSNRELLIAILEAEGLEVTVAEDGASGIAQVTAFHPDLILLDINMPGPSGLEVCSKLKADPDTRLIPIVMVTGLSAVEDRVRALQRGADDFLTKPIERSELVARVRSLISLKSFTDELERAETVLFALARSIEGKDPYTHGHCERLSQYSAKLGLELGQPEEEITALRRAGTVHDIGKVAVPDAVLLKPGRLNEDERMIMQQHPVVGEQICLPLKSFLKVLPIIRHHHEKADGTGYPDGLKGPQIPVTAKILQIVDVFDALTTVRPYKAALTANETLKIMNEEVARGWWDPEIFRQFQDMVVAGEIFNSAAA
jgi:putative two-component system response regulator